MPRYKFEMWVTKSYIITSFGPKKKKKNKITGPYDTLNSVTKA